MSPGKASQEARRSREDSKATTPLSKGAEALVDKLD